MTLDLAQALARHGEIVALVASLSDAPRCGRCMCRIATRMSTYYNNFCDECETVHEGPMSDLPCAKRARRLEALLAGG